jgi:tetratricopeptide (TPR) repeat protein
MDTPSTGKMIEQARSAYEAEDFDEAAKWYERVASEYALQDDLINAAEMQNNRSVSLLRSGKSQEAYLASKGTEIVFAAAGDAHRQAMALGNQASALEAMKRDSEAIQLYQESNELLKKLNEPDLRIYVLQSLSGLYLRKRKFFEAMAAMQSALDLKQHLSIRERILKKLLQVVFNMLGR